jgi:DNA mismatch repair protein MutL
VGRISRLSGDLANQIAAGEVVERPASVVKELAENAIDAGARHVIVHIEMGGKRMVRVEDDGEGMDAEDARLALERHATSKIRRAEDLSAIATLGFRGEALPSIASVCHFLLRTRLRGEPIGTEIRVNGGTVGAIREVGMAEGTSVEVNDLFYNMPARRKFLKSDAAESAQVSRVVTQLSLAHPEVGFLLTSAARKVLECPPVRSFRDRLFQVSGDREALLEVRRETGGVRVTGWVAPLADHGRARGMQNVFVNSRVVKDRTITHAILDAYGAATIKERSPEAHLFLDMPPGDVDVNVHPTKAEVRFRQPSFVHEIVRHALEDALGQGGAPELHLRREPVTAWPAPLAIPGVVGGGVDQNRWRPSVERFRPSWQWPDPATPIAPSHARESIGAGPESATRPMVPLGQFRDTFIIAVDAEGIAIIDQHVAHERVIFERVMERLSSGPIESQRLLVPLVLDLPPGARQVLIDTVPALARLGFELEAFGGTSVKVSAMPALLATAACAEVLLACAADLEGLDREGPAQETLRRLAATTACHAAVKANDPLTYEKMVHILDELAATAYSTVCPHGRPVVLRLTRREIEKRFERV